MNAEEMLAKADVKELMGKRDESIHVLHMITAVDPTVAGAWFRLSRIYIAANDLESARRAVDTGLGHCPQNPELLVESGVIEMMSGELLRSSRLFEQALRIDPKCAEAWAQIGAIHLALDENDEAAAALGRAADLSPDRPEFRYQLAMVQLSRGDTRSAEGEMLKVSAIVPDSPSVQVDLAVMEMSASRFVEAIGRLDALLEDDPLNVRAKFYRQIALGHVVEASKSASDIDLDSISGAAASFLDDGDA